MSSICFSVPSKVQHIMDEMISTEREYVRSLSYVIEHYFPEMERLDLPQDLRGKRSIIFGNVEKLWDFHSQYFLKDLESCAHSPLSISSCFLKHVSVCRPKVGVPRGGPPKKKSSINNQRL